MILPLFLHFILSEANPMPIGIKFYFTTRAAVEDDIPSEHLLLKAKKENKSPL